MRSNKKYLFFIFVFFVFGVLICPRLSFGQTIWCYDFNTNLEIGDSGSGVSNLITALTKENFSNLGGDYFSENIASAVSGFQKKYRADILTPSGFQYGTGYVGPATREKLNQLYGCASAAASSATAMSADQKTQTQINQALVFDQAQKSEALAKMAVLVTGQPELARPQNSQSFYGTAYFPIGFAADLAVSLDFNQKLIQAGKNIKDADVKKDNSVAPIISIKTKSRMQTQSSDTVIVAGSTSDGWKAVSATQTIKSNCNILYVCTITNVSVIEAISQDGNTAKVSISDSQGILNLTFTNNKDGSAFIKTSGLITLQGTINASGLQPISSAVSVLASQRFFMPQAPAQSQTNQAVANLFYDAGVLIDRIYSAINVNVATLASINVSPANASIVIGETQQFNAVAKDQQGNVLAVQPVFSWTSSNSKIATINSSGLATGITAGTVTITASVSGVKSAANLTIASQSSPPSVSGGKRTQMVQKARANLATAQSYYRAAAAAGQKAFDAYSSVWWASTNKGGLSSQLAAAKSKYNDANNAVTNAAQNLFNAQLLVRAADAANVLNMTGKASEFVHAYTLMAENQPGTDIAKQDAKNVRALVYLARLNKEPENITLSDGTRINLSQELINANKAAAGLTSFNKPTIILAQEDFGEGPLIWEPVDNIDNQGQYNYFDFTLPDGTEQNIGPIDSNEPWSYNQGEQYVEVANAGVNAAGQWASAAQMINNEILVYVFPTIEDNTNKVISTESDYLASFDPDLGGLWSNAGFTVGDMRAWLIDKFGVGNGEGLFVAGDLQMLKPGDDYAQYVLAPVSGNRSVYYNPTVMSADEAGQMYQTLFGSNGLFAEPPSPSDSIFYSRSLRFNIYFIDYNTYNMLCGTTNISANTSNAFTTNWGISHYGNAYIPLTFISPEDPYWGGNTLEQLAIHETAHAMAFNLDMISGTDGLRYIAYKSLQDNTYPSGYVQNTAFDFIVGLNNGSQYNYQLPQLSLDDFLKWENNLSKENSKLFENYTSEFLADTAVAYWLNQGQPRSKAANPQDMIDAYNQLIKDGIIKPIYRSNFQPAPKTQSIENNYDQMANVLNSIQAALNNLKQILNQ